MSIIDFHNHVLPGVDDGAQNEAETAAALRALRAEGVSGLIATPHVNAATAAVAAECSARLDAIGAGWQLLQECARREGMQVWRGAEIALDTPWADFHEPLLRLHGTRFVLVEFAYMSVPPASGQLLGQLVQAGWVPVLAHPERYRTFGPLLELAAEWRAAGARLQLNGPSLLGRYGAGPERIARDLLRHGLVDYVCSDYHARGRPRVREYRLRLEQEVGGTAAALLTETNPRRLVDDLAPLPVLPEDVPGAAWRNRWRRFFR